MKERESGKSEREKREREKLWSQNGKYLLTDSFSQNIFFFIKFIPD